MRKFKKGFTIVELVIVIAVIAVLTAVLVPTFIHLTNKANKASDESLVTNLNKALAMRAADQGEAGKNNTMHDAVLDLEEEGYKVSQLITRSGEDLAWSKKANKFFLSESYDEGEYGPRYNCFHIEKSMPSTQSWGIYAGHEWTGNATGLKVSFDAGNASISEVSYVGAEAAQEVVIRTNGGSVEIDALSDKVHHYGDVDTINIKNVASSSFYERGSATFVKVATGRYVVCEGGDVAVGGIFVNSNNAILAVEKNEELPMVTIAETVTSFKLQTTNNEGVKQTESNVTIGEAITTSAAEGSTAVPAAVSVKVERTAEQKSEIVKTEEQAKESSATSRLSDVFIALLKGEKAEYPSEFSINGIVRDGLPLKNPYSGKMLPMGTSANIKYSKTTNSIIFDVYFNTSLYANSFSIVLQPGYITSENEDYVNTLLHFDNLGQYDTDLEGISGLLIGDHAVYGTVVLTDNGKLLCSMNTDYEMVYPLEHHFQGEKTYGENVQLFDLNIKAGHTRDGQKVELKVVKNNVEGTPTVTRYLDFNSALAEFVTIGTTQYKYLRIDGQTTINSRQYQLAILLEVGSNRLHLATYSFYTGNINMEPGSSTSWSADTPDPTTFVIIASASV